MVWSCEIFKSAEPNWESLQLVECLSSTQLWEAARGSEMHSQPLPHSKPGVSLADTKTCLRKRKEDKEGPGLFSD